MFAPRQVTGLLLLLASAALGLGPVQAQSAKPLSEEGLLQLIKLVNDQTITEQVIVTKLQKDGINFAANDATLERLKKAGASAAVLDAVTRAAEARRAATSRPAITYQDVLTLLGNQIDEQAILQRFKESPTTFTLSAEQIEQLKKAGASSTLLAALQEKREVKPGSDVSQIAIILDCSGSMREHTEEGISKMEAAKKAVTDLILRIPNGFDVTFLVYGHDIQRECQAVDVVRPLGPLSVAGKKELIEFIGRLEPVGHTPIALALRTAGKELAKGKGLSQVVLITDGMETCHGDPAKEATTLTKNLNLRSVDVIGFGVDPKERAAVEQIAKAGKGKYLSAEKARELAPKLREVVRVEAPKAPPLPPAEPKEDELANLAGHQGAIRSVAFARDGRRVLSASEQDKTVRQWDTTAKKERDGSRIEYKSFALIKGFVLSPDGRRFLAQSGQAVELWDTETKKPVYSLSVSPHIHCMAISANGRRFIIGYSQILGKDRVGVWDIETGKQLRLFEGHKGMLELRCVALSSDGRRAASSDKDGVRVWDVETGQQLQKLDRPTVRSMAFSPDGKYLVTGEALEAVVLWDVQTGNEVRRFEGHTSAIPSVAFSPDGRHLLSGGEDKTVRLWEMETGKVLHRFEGHTEPVWCLAFSPDGRRAVSGSKDTTVRVWNVAKYTQPK